MYIWFLGWVLDPRDRPILGPQLIDKETGCFEIRSELDFVLYFWPMEYFCNTVISATNTYAAKSKTNIKVFGSHWISSFSRHIIVYGDSWYPWAQTFALCKYENGLFPSVNDGKVMSCNWFEDIMIVILISK